VASFDIEAVVARIRSEIGPASPAGGEADISWLLQQYAEVRAVIVRLDRRNAAMERNLQGLTIQIRSVLESRIWQTLVKLSGILLRVTRLGSKRSS
jgi:hypothetical protein